MFCFYYLLYKPNGFNKFLINFNTIHAHQSGQTRPSFRCLDHDTAAIKAREPWLLQRGFEPQPLGLSNNAFERRGVLVGFEPTTH